MTVPTHVVMIGGGYASLFAYRSLRRSVRAGRVRVSVVSADDHHNFHGFTGEVVAGHLPHRLTRAPLWVLMPLAEFVHGTVVEVDPEHDAVLLRPAGGGPVRTIGYDQLVVAAGGREPLTDIPGLAEHGFSLRAPGEFGRFMRRLDDPDGRPGPVVIVGGGMAGAELAAAMATRLRAQGRENGVLLAHSGDRVVAGVRAEQPRLGAVVDRELERLGVRMRSSVRVERVGRTGVQLSDGTAVPAWAVLATHGQRAVLLPGLEALDRDEDGRLVVDRNLSAGGNIWAAGDVARVPHPATGRAVTADALWAIKAGAHLGRNLSRVASGHRARPFRYRGLGRAMSFGIGRAAAELYGVPISGWLGWLLRLVFFLRFMPLRRQTLGVVAAFVSLPVRRRFLSVPDGFSAVSDSAVSDRLVEPEPVNDSSGRTAEVQRVG